MSARSINAADTVLVLASGRNKANAVAGWCRGDSLPISAIRPSGALDVMLTADAAGNANWLTPTGR
jgi:6-phosphogluconolactonase/glucosamine-6-phosphate isomerase/deaminase